MIFSKLKFKYIFYLLYLFSGLLSYNNAIADIPLDRIVAVVNDDVIMQSELEDRARMVLKQMSKNNAQRPPMDIFYRQVLESMIMNKLQLQYAAKTGIKVDDDTLNQTLKRVAAENKVSLTKFREILEKEGINYENFREDLRDQIIITRLKQRNVDNQVTVTEREINNYLANQQHQGGVEKEYHLLHILIALPENPTDEETAQSKLVADKVIKDLKNGADFAELAKTVSQGQQASDGGDLGWRKFDDLPTLFSDVVKTMQPGDTSPIIKSPSGFHIIKLVDVRGADKHMVTQTHARHILIRTNELISDETAKSRLNQLKIRIEGGDDFAELARAHSDDMGSAVKGGDLGWINPGTMVPEFEKEMDKLKPGETSEPFKTQFGWHIVQVMERREYDDTAEQKRRNAIEAIRAKKIEELQQNWLRNLRDEAYVEYRLDDTQE